MKNEDNLANNLPAIVAGKCGKPADLGRALGSAAFTWDGPAEKIRLLLSGVRQLTTLASAHHPGLLGA